MTRLAQPGRWVVGIDTSQESLLLARQTLSGQARCDVAAMDAAEQGFRAGAFDAVICIQNGICAFQVDPGTLLQEALRVVRPQGLVLFSTYADVFWPHRLEWFGIQAAERLVGDIDYSATRPGEIVCKDGFRSAALSARDFTTLCGRFGVEPMLIEVDESSLFCEITSRGAVTLPAD